MYRKSIIQQGRYTLYQFMGFFRVKNAYFGGFAPYLDEYLTFTAKYYIKPPKNHWRLSNGNCLSDISHLGELDMAYYSSNGS